MARAAVTRRLQKLLRAGISEKLRNTARRFPSQRQTSRSFAVHVSNRSFLAIVIAASTLGGCATVFKSKTSTVTVTSDTPGAAVSLDGRAVGVTPTSVAVGNKRDAMIVVSNGGKQHTCQLVSHASAGWVVADVFLTSGLGFVIDWVTHAWNNVDPGECHASV
jgi:hypothetical protein